MAYEYECKDGMFGGDPILYPLCWTCEWSRGLEEKLYDPSKCYCAKYPNVSVGKPSYLGFATDSNKCRYYIKGKTWTKDELWRVGQIRLEQVKEKYPDLFK